MNSPARFVAMLFATTLSACSCHPSTTTCAATSDCPTGYVCQQQQCVHSTDSGPVDAAIVDATQPDAASRDLSAGDLLGRDQRAADVIGDTIGHDLPVADRAGRESGPVDV